MQDKNTIQQKVIKDDKDIKNLLDFNRDEINWLERRSYNYIRFKDKSMKNFNFIFENDIIKTFNKLLEARVLFSHCVMTSEQMAGKPHDLEKINNKVKNLIKYIDDLKFEELLWEHDFGVEYGNDNVMFKLQTILNNNKESIINILNFSEMLRPLYQRKLSKSTGGVSSQEFEDIEIEEGEIEQESKGSEDI